MDIATAILTLDTTAGTDALLDVITGAAGANTRYPLTADAWTTVATAAGYTTDDEDADVDEAAHAAAVRVLVALDLCPVHVCDIDICADDDDAVCARFRG